MVRHEIPAAVDLADVVDRVVARYLGLRPERSLARLTSAERQLLLPRVRDAVDDSVAPTLCWAIEEFERLRPGSPAYATDASFRSASPGEPPSAAAIVALVHLADPIGLLCVDPGDVSVDGLDDAARWLLEFSTQWPRIPIGLALTAERMDDFRQVAGSSAAKAFACENITVVQGLDRRRIEDHWVARTARSQPAAGPIASTVDLLERVGATQDLVVKAADAVVQAEAAKTTKAEADEASARSAAEAFLFALLEATSDLAGVFALNAPADFHFGSKPAELDLASHRLRIAIELDGYYHFRDRDAYRRDRRKDLALQRHGYLVLRFLSEDVVAQAEEILDTIRYDVAQRTANTAPY